MRIATWLLVVLAAAATAGAGGENAAQALTRASHPPTRDVTDSRQAALYAVGYAHLDTQWRWDYVRTIDEYIRATLDDNFELFERFPEYVFNFTGSVRYRMMKEYYPERYEKLKEYIAQGRWRVSGSSVDEGDVNVPSVESMIRHVLYGNQFFREEFGKESVDFMLPDCFGFPASMPSVWAHCGLLGFSTQKLSWGSAVGIPFGLGVWEGPDGNSIIAALDPGAYVGAIEGSPAESGMWRERVRSNGEQHGVWADYHYYGVGDEGGAPRAEDVERYVESAARVDTEMGVVLAASDQLYKDITPELRARLPRYKGDLLLTEHSAGTLTSQSAVKRWNRKAELLADAAERAAVAAWWLAGEPYPHGTLRAGWERVLATQMHDILPGTSVPQAYRWSWNDQVVAMNLFAGVLTEAVGRVAAKMDTEVEGTPVVVFNPLEFSRTEPVEAWVELGDAPAVRVVDSGEEEIPSQIVERDGGWARVLFVASLPPHGFRVFSVEKAERPFEGADGSIDHRSVSNGTVRVEIDERGDISSVRRLDNSREALSAPARLVFTGERPRSWPAWNMDWSDRLLPPIGAVDGQPEVRIVERGPVRWAIEVTRRARNSAFRQTIRLGTGDLAHLVEVDCDIEWQSAGVALRASFPLTASNPTATYNLGLGTIERGNNEPKRYEVPSRMWVDLPDRSGEFGVTLVEDCRYGWDKPSDEELRLTLVYSPGVRGTYMDQHSQDWGRHRLRYGISMWEAGVEANNRRPWRIGRMFNQGLIAMRATKHGGELGASTGFRCWTLESRDLRTVTIPAMKLAESERGVVLRLQGNSADPVHPLDVRVYVPEDHGRVAEIDGQERELREERTIPSHFQLGAIGPFGLRSFLIEPSGRRGVVLSDRVTAIELPFDADVMSDDAERSDGAMDSSGRSYPADLLPGELLCGGVPFELGSGAAGEANAVACRGQAVELPGGSDGSRTIHLLVAATEDASATFLAGDHAQQLEVQRWRGFVGQWDDRVFDRGFAEVDHRSEGRVVAILPGFVKRQPIAWFATHTHDPERGNVPYEFCYLFHATLECPPGAGTMTLPYDERIRVFAATVEQGGARVEPAAPLYDTLEGHTAMPILHDYDARPPALHDGLEPLGRVDIDREREWDLLSMGAPSSEDEIDASRGGPSFQIFTDGGRLPARWSAGIEGGAIPRMNDGDWAQNHDDTDRCVWWDNEGRFTVDLGSARPIESIRTYSWHRSDRAPQKFSVWGSSAAAMPSAAITLEDQQGWEFIAYVDTSGLGQGDKHGSGIMGRDGALGPYRHLLFVAEDMGQGTFFTEIDVGFAPEE